MKCTRCGAEVEAQKFCIYCGERLQGKESLSVQRRSVRAHSGVLRFRHRATISQTSLPEVQKRQPESSKMQLASLSGTQQHSVSRSSSMHDDFNKNVRDRSSQSRELEALLLKLNGQDSSMSDDAFDVLDEDDLYEEDSLEDMDSLDVDMDTPDSLVDNSFFIGDETRDVSGPVPMGSGSFSRIPSGGFHLVIDSIKSACQGMMKRIQSLGNSKDSSRCSSIEISDRKRKMAIIGAVVLTLCLIGTITYWTVNHDDAPESSEQLAIAAQAPVGGNEDFAILALEEPEQNIEDLTFDPDDFSIPELDFAVNDTENTEIKNTEIEIAAIPEVEPAPAVAEKPVKQEAVAQNSAVKAENRTYGKKDNVMATVLKGDTFKVSRSCIMREGPASRFGLVKQIPSGAKIQVLTTTEEDWVLQSGGVWTKAGETSKLGPGTQFADAPKGAKLPQPKSRVISASNWKYVKSGDLYGYVGPACFK